MAGISISMNCPNCGGSLSVMEGTRVTSCIYCTALLTIKGDEGVQKTMLRNKVTRTQAIEEVRRWWRGGYKARDLKSRGLIMELYPIYVPFWRLKARATGWVCGYKESADRDSDVFTHRERVPLEEMIIRDFDWHKLACDPGDFGIGNLDDFEGEALLHDDGAIPTFEVTMSRADAVEMCIRQTTNEATAYAGVPQITFRDVHVFPKSLGLTYYPIWVVRYSYSDRVYSATVDGVTGMVIAGRAPGDSLSRSLIMAAGMAIGGIGFGFSAWIGLSDGTWVGMVFAIAGILGSLAIAVGTFPLFRYGSEMTTGTVSGGYNIVKGGYDSTSSSSLREIEDS